MAKIVLPHSGYKKLDLAAGPADLEARLAKIIESARRSVQSIKRRKGL